MEKNRIALMGAEAAAFAMKQINPEVVPAYPITPQTEIMHKFAEYVADGKVDTEMILVESEHSAMSCAVGASAAGARVMTATSSAGLALMHEIVFIAAGYRQPIVMNVVNRALSGPINIHCDHSDSMAERDSGWIQIFCEDGQEVYDNTLLAVKLGEHPDVKLPVMVCQDGFITSHCVQDIVVQDDMDVKNYLGERTSLYPLLDTDAAKTYGPLDLQDYYFEHKRQQVDGMKNALLVYKDVGVELSRITGRNYEYYETYMTEDADYVLVVLSSTAGTTRVAVDEFRAQGLKVGLLKIKLFRPFPHFEIQKILAGRKGVVVLDRSDTTGAFGGPVFQEIKNAVFGTTTLNIKNYIFGLGGRDVNVDLIKRAFTELVSAVSKKDLEYFRQIGYLGVRE